MGHATMVGWVTVMTPADYQRWLNAGGAQASLVARGERLYRSLGCSGCHGENALIRAPSLAGLVRPSRAAGHGRDRHGGRPVPPRLDPAAAETDRRQLRADHAELRGADRRGGSFPVDPVHQEPGRRRAGRIPAPEPAGAGADAGASRRQRSSLPPGATPGPTAYPPPPLSTPVARADAAFPAATDFSREPDDFRPPPAKTTSTRKRRSARGC